MGHGDTRNPKPETRNPDRTGDMGMGRDMGIHEIGNPKSETRDPKLENRNPKPETRNLKPGSVQGTWEWGGT